MGISDYLEIGIAHGKTFQEIDVQNKIGCDPHPVMNESNKVSIAKNRIFSLTSDDFFSLSLRNKFGLIFVDGLHTSSQVAKDFVNSLRFSTENTIWLIDDVFPDSTTSEQTSLSKYRIRRLIDLFKNFLWRKPLALKIGWQGDVWKFIKALSSVKEFNVITFVVDNEKIQSLVSVNKKHLKSTGIRFPFNSQLILEQLSSVMDTENCSMRNLLNIENHIWNEDIHKLHLPEFYNVVSHFDVDEIIEFYIL
jgi:hypothetical protein